MLFLIEIYMQYKPVLKSRILDSQLYKFMSYNFREFLIIDFPPFAMPLIQSEKIWCSDYV